jgi:hypothetical protein
MIRSAAQELSGKVAFAPQGQLLTLHGALEKSLEPLRFLPNNRLGAGAEWRVLFASPRPWSRADQGGCSAKEARTGNEP